MPFTGRVVNDDLHILGEDLSEIVRLLSITHTPLLDALPQASVAAKSTIHAWQSRDLVPDRITAVSAINSTTAATGITINGFGKQLQVGMVLELEGGVATEERVRITSIAGPNSILVERNLNGSGVSSLAANGTLFVIGTSTLEGEDTIGDVTRPRSEFFNLTQIFKKPVTFSGTRRAVTTVPSLGDEFDLEVANRTIELLKDYEKTLVRGVMSNTIGSDTVYRTMGGLRHFITEVNSTVTAGSMTVDPLTYLNAAFYQAWNRGARDIDLVLCGPLAKQELSNTNVSKLTVLQAEDGIRRSISTVETDYGIARVLMSPYLSDREVIGISTSRVIPMPLQGRSFQKEDLAKTGDSTKAHVIGEYTAEIHGPNQMFRYRGI